MARSFTVELAEVFQLLHGQVVARQMQKRVNQHGSVAVGEHKAVAVAPMRVAGVVVQMLAPQSDCDIGPCPWARRDVLSWLVEQRPLPKRELRWPSVGDLPCQGVLGK